MSWALNQGPSFDTTRKSPYKLNGFFQRFELLQDDNRMTPGKRQPVTKPETMKGTFALKKPSRARKDKRIKYSDAIPAGQPTPTYSGFANIKNKATTRVVKSGRKLKRRRKK